ncbi:Nicotinamide riboside transporter PnuC [Tsuneonella dongtanensis]|uniref:Nicotinamide riboside transporter PnuC n=1 Tax=Tsuneonella dongtanensis TaxID=692370 RepID=A0A1B2AAW4_9SPHN|nr:nicotinamide riboside transporter PnuC [Tsuneonella dongtanensis]ANY19299.1 Nicotinamide riboside transporter PnuC [Tsuneonella dongtanensis]
MSPLEIAGTVLGLINIVLLIRRSVWNFPVAMAMVSCIGVVLFGARLYAEAGLQVFFFVVNAWGWWMWSRAKGRGDTVPVRWLDWPSRIGWAAGAAIFSVLLGLALARWTDAALPMADSAVAGMSVVAQILLGLRRIENWVLWIVIDVVSIALYLDRGLNLLAALYFAFLVLSVVGLREWTRSTRMETA